MIRLRAFKDYTELVQMPPQCGKFPTWPPAMLYIRKDAMSELMKAEVEEKIKDSLL